MCRRDMRRSIVVALAIIAGIFLLSPGLTFGGVFGGAGPTVSSPVSVGQTGLPWSFSITNTSTPTNNTHNIEAFSILFTTACGVPSPDADGHCPAGQREAANTIEITPLTGKGQAGTACAGIDFTVTPTGIPNEYAFTPNVTLGPNMPPGNAGTTCTVNFTVNINAGVKDTTPPRTTSPLTYVKLRDDLPPPDEDEFGFAAGSTNVTVNLCNPTIVTTPNPLASGHLSTVLNDSATLTGDAGCPNVVPTGTITFKLFGPNDQNCSGQPICTNTVNVNGTGTYSTSSGCTVTAEGTYHWVATYSGDISNNGVSSICADEAVVIKPPNITTTPNPTSGLIGTVLNDCAILSDGVNPTGTITFKLYDVDDPACGGTSIFTNTIPLTAACFTPQGCCTSNGFTANKKGTYHWIATYSGDGGNDSVSSICTNEAVLIDICHLTIATTPNPSSSGRLQTVLNDSATLTPVDCPNVNPTGTITFDLYDVNDPTCSGTSIFTNTVQVDHGFATYPTSNGFTTDKTGTYHWIATYSGDGSYNSASSICANEAVVISQIKIRTTPNPSSGQVGTVLNDCATLSDGVNPTGTITFKLYDVDDPACGGTSIFTNTIPVTAACFTPQGCCTSNGFTTVTEGTYHWIATYSGDANNDSVSSDCALEAVVIGRTPRAGEDPFIAVVGNDIEANRFYLSPKHELFLYDQTLTGLPTAGEAFASSSTEPAFPEICDINGVVNGPADWTYEGLPTRLVGLENDGWFRWSIRLPKNLNALNICFECGVVKPNTFQVFGFDAVLHCAANTGERQFPGGVCTRDDVNPGQNPVIAGAQPTITAIAAPGPNNAFTPFYLTAYRNPGTYNNLAQPMASNQALQVLNGTPSARVMLKSCLDKCINIKIPVTGQINAANQVEEDLQFGDLITITMTIPRTNTVDIYCGAESAKLTGIGEALIPVLP